MSRTRTALLFALALPLAATGSWAGAPGDYADGPRLDDAPPALKALLEEARPTAFSEANAADAARIISRQQVVRQTALSYGAQSGLHWRHGQIMELLERESQLMSTLFDFSRFLVDGQLLLPVVEKTERIYDQAAPGEARTVDVSYALRRPARLVPAAPSWRDYMTLTVDAPSAPAAALYPRTDAEADAWRAGLRRGWELGVSQAEDIFRHELRQLTAEIAGMHLFRELLAQGIVSMPQTASSRYPVLRTADGQRLHVDDVITTITKRGSFMEASNWQPVLLPSESGQ